MDGALRFPSSGIPVSINSCVDVERLLVLLGDPGVVALKWNASTSEVPTTTPYCYQIYD